MFREAKSGLTGLWGLVLAVLLALMPSLAHAQGENRGFSYHSEVPCFAAAWPDDTVEQLLGDPARWSCEAMDTLPADTRQLVVRFDVQGLEIAQPGLLINSHTYRETAGFTRFQVSTIGETEIAASAWLTLDEFQPTSPVWKTRVEAPVIAEEVRTILVRIEAPQSPSVASRFDLVDTAPTALIANSDQLIAAVLCGLLLAPAFIGVGHYRALRSRFAIYHVIFCLLAVVQVAALGGLLPLVMEISRQAQFVILHLSFDLICAISALFAASFIEQDKISRRSRKVLYALAVLALTLGIMRVTLGMTIGVQVAIIYYAGYLAFLAGLLFVLAQTIRSGSRASWFLMVSFSPLLLIGIIRVVLALTTTFEIRFHAVLMQHFALSWHVVVSAFAVADRFLIIRRERDRARAAAQTLERASERDTLTGVYNRRIIAERYARLHQEGFTSLAVLDLDHFKRINDTFGHAAGDKVLRAVARALEPDPNTIVIRMGGEEFALLLRGDDVLDRAERRRLAVSNAAAEALGDADQVTASMGIVELPTESAPPMDFDALYERADLLLYEAKNSGRDRTVSEKLKLFSPSRADERRKRDRRAAA